MTVRELANHLKEVDQDMPVVVLAHCHERDTFVYLDPKAEVDQDLAPVWVIDQTDDQIAQLKPVFVM